MFLTAGLAQQPRTAVTFSPPQGARGEGVLSQHSTTSIALRSRPPREVQGTNSTGRAKAIHGESGPKTRTVSYTVYGHHGCTTVTYGVKFKRRSVIKTKPVLIAYGNFSPPGRVVNATYTRKPTELPAKEIIIERRFGSRNNYYLRAVTKKVVDCSLSHRGCGRVCTAEGAVTRKTRSPLPRHGAIVVREGGCYTSSRRLNSRIPTNSPLPLFNLSFTLDRLCARTRVDYFLKLT